MLYPYQCPACSLEHLVVKPVAQASDPEPCPICDTVMDRLYTGIQVNVPNPQIAAGVTEARARGVEAVSAESYGDIKPRYNSYELSRHEEAEISARLSD
jgi:hypothetical protein